jgi:hypothetical protein
VVGFAGGRVTKAEEVASHERFTTVFLDKLRPVFDVFGVTLRARNGARGPAMTSFP